MGMAAILVMRPWPFEGILVPPTHRGFTWNLALTCPVASEEKIFGNVDGRRTTDDGRRTADAYLYYKLTNEPSAQVS